MNEVSGASRRAVGSDRCCAVARTAAVGLALLLLASGAQAKSPYILLGPQQSFPDQPYVTVELLTEDPLHPGTWISLGPDDGGGTLFGFGYNSFLLDTGANAILAVDAAAASLMSNGMVTEAEFLEMGVAGATLYEVSAPYRFVFAGTDGVEHVLPQTGDGVRIQSNPYTDLGGPVDFGGIAGLVGMPAMVNRVTTLDFSAWSNMTDILDLTTMEVRFTDDLPSSNGHRYSVAVDNRLAFSAADGRPEWEDPNSPLPTYADVPFMTAIAGHHDAEGSLLDQSGTFLVDTGAQFSVISRSMAFRLGMDTNGDGDLSDDAIDFVQVGGVGGTRNVPILLLDEFRLPTLEGVDLVWKPTDPEDMGLQFLVLDVFETGDVDGDGVVTLADADIVQSHWEWSVAEGDLPSGDVTGDGLVNQGDLDVILSQMGQDTFIDGIFGVDLLTAGVTFTMELEIEGDPYFQQVHFDFHDMDEGSGTIFFDLTASYDVVQTPPLLGDANDDGKVDDLDATILALHWHQSVAGGASQGDFNGDGMVNERDASILASHWLNGVTLVLGDANGDGKVDDVDASIVAVYWHQSVAGGASQGDFNGDGMVNEHDASILASHWLTGVGEAGGAVPEPTTVMLLLAALASWLARGVLGWRRKVSVG